jgi:DNA-binding NarL/FixJ family response regulator
VAERLDDVAALYNEGASQREIAAYLGYGPTSIPPELDQARKRGLIGTRHALQGDGIVEIRDSIVEGCLADGWPREDIAAAVGLAPKSIHTVLKRLRARSA